MLFFSEIENTMVVGVSGTNKFYAWKFPDKTLVDTPRYIGSIVHNSEGKAMLNFILTKTGEDVYRTEINPLHCRDIDEWVMDD